MDTRTNILLQNFNLQNLSVVHHIIRLAPQLEPQPQIWWNYMSSSGGAYLGVHVFQLHPFHKHVVVEFGIPSVALSSSPSESCIQAWHPIWAQKMDKSYFHDVSISNELASSDLAKVQFARNKSLYFIYYRDQFRGLSWYPALPDPSRQVQCRLAPFCTGL